jgi:hypothetical protein
MLIINRLLAFNKACESRFFVFKAIKTFDFGKNCNQPATNFRGLKDA